MVVALVGAFSVITNLRMDLFEALENIPAAAEVSGAEQELCRGEGTRNKL